MARVDDGAAEDDGARTAGELAAMQHREDAGGCRALRSSGACLDDVTVRRR